MSKLCGLWLPIVTPFRDGRIDHESFERLLVHYSTSDLDGILLLGTTGEAPTIEDAEADALIQQTLTVVGGRLPVYVGVGGNATDKVVRSIKRLQGHAVSGFLSVCPYYNKPSQDGLFEHFSRIAEATDRPVLVYNIPYRTGVNLANDTLMRLADLPTIVGVMDSCGSLIQSIELLRRRPAGFAVMTGEDAAFYTMLAQGCDGGILASAHIMPDRFATVYRHMAANDHLAGRSSWAGLEHAIALLFRESNPMPIKYCLWRQGLIASPECRLPLTRVSATLAAQLDELMELGILSNGKPGPLQPHWPQQEKPGNGLIWYR